MEAVTMTGATRRTRLGDLVTTIADSVNPELVHVVLEAPELEKERADRARERIRGA